MAPVAPYNQFVLAVATNRCLLRSEIFLRVWKRSRGSSDNPKEQDRDRIITDHAATCTNGCVEISISSIHPQLGRLTQLSTHSAYGFDEVSEKRASTYDNRIVFLHLDVLEVL